jgi:hypothetical protein
MKRSHRLYEPLLQTIDAAALKDLARLETLVAARFEPGIRQGMPIGLVDLVFARDDAFALAPLIVVDPAMLIEREDDPFVWPHTIESILDDAVLDSIGEFLYPWLYSRSVTHDLCREDVRVFQSAYAPTLERARSAGFLCACSYAVAIGGAAPALYARRHAARRRVGVASHRCAAAAHALDAQAADLAVDLGSAELNVFAAQWYRSGRFRTIAPEERFDVWISPGDATRVAAVRVTTDGVPDAFHAVSCARTIPLTAILAFDETDASATPAFGVHVAESVRPRELLIEAVSSTGGSAGRIALGARRTLWSAPDADTDDVLTLSGRLRGEGFTVDVVAAGDDVDAYDLVHVFGLLHAEESLALLERAGAAGKPTVLTPALEDLGAFGVWGTAAACSVFATTYDQRELAPYLGFLAAHALHLPGMNARERHEPRAGFDAAARAALSRADVVIAGSPAEERLLREQYAREGPVFVCGPHLDAMAPLERVEHLVGQDPFVLLHAPVEPRCNQIIVALAARSAGLPLVIAGPVVDAPYAEFVREAAGDRTTFIPEATLAQVRAFYPRARVFVDAAWIGTGLHRLAYAAASGCALVSAGTRYAADLWRSEIWEVDPASVDSMAAGMLAAWSAAPGEARARAERVARCCDPAAALIATVSAYAVAQSASLNNLALPAEIQL